MTPVSIIFAIDFFCFSSFASHSSALWTFLTMTLCACFFLEYNQNLFCFSKLKNHQADQTLQFWKLVKLAYLNAWAATHLNIQHGRGNELIPTFIQKLLARTLLWLIYHKLVAKLNSKRKILHKFNSKKNTSKTYFKKEMFLKTYFKKRRLNSKRKYFQRSPSWGQHEFQSSTVLSLSQGTLPRNSDP